MKKAMIALVLLVGCAKQEPGLTQVEKPRLASTGQEVFERVFSDSTGLGPLFNATSCADCHNRDDDAPVLGGAGDEIERHMEPGNCLDPAIVLHEFPTPEVAVNPTGLRSSNDLFGLGHLDQLTDEEIKAYVAAEPRFLGFIDGNYWYNTPNLNINRAGQVGRFGRRAQGRSLDEFVRGALVNEMGVEPGVEIGEDQVAQLVEFVRGLSRPLAKASGGARDAAPPFGFRNFTIPPGHAKGAPDSIVVPPPSPPPDSTPSGELVTTGRTLFRTIGCAVCHNPETEYTDLALHDLGETNICEGNGFGVISGRVLRNDDFRTEPLTGLGLQTRFMHDGASTTLSDAIARHGGEAGYSRAQFNHLTDRDNALRAIGQQSILAFLRSL